MAHLKTPFFIDKIFEEEIREILISSAKNYFSLCNKNIHIVSDSFIKKKEYIAKFYKSNFLHLTGVKTSMRPECFFDACYRGIIAIDDFDCNSSKALKRVVCSKLKHLVTLSNFFENEIIAQEDFSKGVVKCLLGVSNRKFTIEFVDAKYCVRPMTLLTDNHLDKNKVIINAKIIID